MPEERTPPGEPEDLPATLLGAELTAQLERSRRVEAGRPRGEPFPELREAPG